jgi:hypothetical protein
VLEHLVYTESLNGAVQTIRIRSRQLAIVSDEISVNPNTAHVPVALKCGTGSRTGLQKAQKARKLLLECWAIELRSPECLLWVESRHCTHQVRSTSAPPLK